MPDGKFSTLKKTNGKITYKPVGVNKATTFYGFCQEHDNDLFADIDNIDWVPTEKQLALGFFRSLCFEILQKARASSNISNAHNILAKNLGFDPDKSFSLPLASAVFQQLGIIDVLPLFKHLQDAIRKQYFIGHLSYVSWKTEEIMPLACLGVFAPAYDIQGKSIQDYFDHTTPLENIMLAVLPTSQGSKITVACLKNYTTAHEFINSLMQENETRIPDTVAKLIMENCENHCCNPTWYNGLTARKKRDISKCLQQLAPKKTVYRNFSRIIENTAILDSVNI